MTELWRVRLSQPWSKCGKSGPRPWAGSLGGGGTHGAGVAEWEWAVGTWFGVTVEPGPLPLSVDSSLLLNRWGDRVRQTRGWRWFLLKTTLNPMGTGWRELNQAPTVDNFSTQSPSGSAETVTLLQGTPVPLSQGFQHLTPHLNKANLLMAAPRARLAKVWLVPPGAPGRAGSQHCSPFSWKLKSDQWTIL